MEGDVGVGRVASWDWTWAAAGAARFGREIWAGNWGGSGFLVWALFSAAGRTRDGAGGNRVGVGVELSRSRVGMG